MMQKALSKLELTGSFIAIACAVHCMAIPVLLSFGSVGLAGHLEHHYIELGFLLASLLFASWSLIVNYRKGRINSIPVVLFLFGFSFLILSILAHWHILSAFGGIAIAVAHYINWRQLRRSHQHI